MEETEEKADISDQIKGIKTRRVKWPILEKANLFGLEFHLFGPWHRYEDRMSFVFLIHEIPALNGLLVMVEDHEECQYYDYELKSKRIGIYVAENPFKIYYLEP